MSNAIKLSISGMSCDGCANAVQNCLSAVEGVDEAVVSFDEGSATVNGQASAEMLIAAITQAGYSATELNG